MFDLDGREEVLWVMVERGVWRQHVSTVFFEYKQDIVLFYLFGKVLYVLNICNKLGLGAGCVVYAII